MEKEILKKLLSDLKEIKNRGHTLTMDGFIGMIEIIINE